jgi:hypothetical protein
MQPYWAQWPYLARFVVLNNPKQMKYHVYKGSEMQLSISLEYFFVGVAYQGKDIVFSIHYRV